MLNLSGAFGSSDKASSEGVWVSLGEDSEIKVRRLGSPKVQRAYRNLPKNVQRQVESGTLSSQQATRFVCQFLAENVLVDWAELEDEGEPLGDYDSEVASKLLQKYHRLRDRVWELAQDEDLFNIEEDELVGNS